MDLANLKSKAPGLSCLGSRVRVNGQYLLPFYHEKSDSRVSMGTGLCLASALLLKTILMNIFKVSITLTMATFMNWLPRSTDMTAKPSIRGH